MSDDRRLLFVKACLSRFGDGVLWGDLDCSDLVARGEKDVGLADRRYTFRAQTYADHCYEAVELPQMGDLGFFGRDWQHVIHVIVALDERHVLSADGATSRIRTREEAEKAGARVRIHTGVHWYHSAPFLGWRRHHELDI